MLQRNNEAMPIGSASVKRSSPSHSEFENPFSPHGLTLFQVISEIPINSQIQKMIQLIRNDMPYFISTIFNDL